MTDIIKTAEECLQVVDIERVGTDLQRIGHKLADLGKYLEEEADINITHIDNRHFDLLCGDVSDELFVISSLIKKLVYKFTTESESA